MQGRQVIYEINTNPTIGPPAAQTTPIREQALAAARRRLAALLWRLDSGDGSPVAVETGALLEWYRKTNEGRRWPVRP